MTRPDWDKYFLEIAKVVSTRATCKKRKVGAVVVDFANRIIGTGYNGSPPNQPHCEDVGCLERNGHCLSSIHADLNSIIHCQNRAELLGATMYIHGGTPCISCAQAIVSAGIRRLVCSEKYPDEEAIDFLKKTGVEINIRG